MMTKTIGANYALPVYTTPAKTGHRCQYQGFIQADRTGPRGIIRTDMQVVQRFIYRFRFRTARNGRPCEYPWRGFHFRGSDPLYVLDGMPIEANVFRSLNPNDFATVDAPERRNGCRFSGGSHGANGVIVITTKNGKTGKTQPNTADRFGFSGSAFTPITSN